MPLLAQVQRNYIKILFPVTVCLLFVTFFYTFNLKPLPKGPDLCAIAKEAERSRIEAKYNISKQWWEWACLLEQEWDKGKEYDCRDERKVGNYFICFDEPYKPKPPCLVYSFGIDNDFRFDDGMADLGCEVYSFDPSMGVADHQRSERVRFLNLGLATTDSDAFIPLMDSYTENSIQRWKIRKLSSIKKLLGHTNRALDVLKMDIETYEWTVVKQLLQDGSLHSVKQLTLEWHIFPNDPVRSEFHDMFNTYQKLKDAGFRQFYMDGAGRHHTRYFFNSQADNSLVNTRFQQDSKGAK